MRARKRDRKRVREGGWRNSYRIYAPDIQFFFSFVFFFIDLSYIIMYKLCIYLFTFYNT